MKYFDIEELVDKKVYLKYGQRSWSFFDIRLLETLEIIREAINSPITINNWREGGGFSQRGLRYNLSEITKSHTQKDKIYLSAHCLGMAVDFNVKGLTANEVRIWIYDNQDLLPYKIRLEGGVSWVHLDVEDYGKNKITIFNA